jgi:hypothetical protein
MRLDKHLNELAMRAGTKITTKGDKNYTITLSSGDYFKLGLVKSMYKYWSMEKHSEKKLVSWEILFQDEKKSMVAKDNPKGSKVALELFAAIQQVVTEFIKKEKPEVIKFSSNKIDKSKIKLYKLLAMRISKKHGYVIKTKQERDNILIRKDLV